MKIITLSILSLFAFMVALCATGAYMLDELSLFSTVMILLFDTFFVVLLMDIIIDSINQLKD